MKFYALHGFLGRPHDWDGFGVIPCDIYSFAQPSTQIGLREWGTQFNLYAGKGKKVVMGYSLGGRLALHALLDSPENWSAAVIISAHVGLESSQLRLQRLQDDQQWANRFLTEPWPTLMEAWNRQSVFGPSPFLRNELDYSRGVLADTLRYWSLGHQESLLPQLTQLEMPILWVAGENDKRYCSMATALQFRHPKSRIWIAPGAAHRVPWDSPHAFREQLHLFLETL